MSRKLNRKKFIAHAPSTSFLRCWSLFPGLFSINIPGIETFEKLWRSSASDSFNLSINLSFQFAWEVLWVNKNTKESILSSFFFLNYWIITFFILQILLTQFWFYIPLILWFQFSTVLRLATLNDGWLILVKVE